MTTSRPYIDESKAFASQRVTALSDCASALCERPSGRRRRFAPKIFEKDSETGNRDIGGSRDRGRGRGSIKNGTGRVCRSAPHDNRVWRGSFLLV